MRPFCDNGRDESGPAGEPSPCGLGHADAVAVSMICRLVSGSAGEDELAAAKEWRDMNPDHAQAFARISHAWTLIKPAGVTWRRKQRARLLASALRKAGTFLLGCRPALLRSVQRSAPGQAAPAFALRHRGNR